MEAQYEQDPVGGGRAISIPPFQQDKLVKKKKAITDTRSKQYRTLVSPLLWFRCEIFLTSLNTLSLGNGAVWMVSEPLGFGAWMVEVNYWESRP